MALQENLGKAIQRLRKQEGISQEKLALDAGIDRKYMSDIENGKRNLSLDIIERLAKYFSMPVSQIFELAEDYDRAKKKLDDVKKKLCERDFEESVVLENPDYLTAIVGVSTEGQVIYSYDKMVDWLINYKGMEEEDAFDFLSYNTLRSLPYAGEMAPIVIYNLDI